MKSQFLEKMGLVGWDEVEPIIIASLLANKAVMFCSQHGGAKTEAASTIAYSFLRGSDDGSFRYFNCPIATQDELLGYPDPLALKQGKLRYIPTKISVWGGCAVLMDEINRASMGMQGKFMELALTGQVMGQETGIGMRFAAVNPPDQYLTIPMDLAALSRFSIVSIPSLKDIIARDKSNIKKISHARLAVVDMTTDWERMKKTKIPEDVHTMIDKVIEETIERIINTHTEIKFSGRQLNDFRKKLIGFFKYYGYTGIDLEEEELKGLMSNVTMSCIPECSGLVNSSLSVESSVVRSSSIEATKRAMVQIETHKIESKILDPIRKGSVSAKDMESILDSMTPDKWRNVRDGLPLNKIWERINDTMACLNIDPDLHIDDMLDIKNIVEAF